MLKAAVLVAVSVFAIEGSSAELKPYRCITESTVGAKITKSNIRAASFSDREEYRIKPNGDWFSDLAAEGGFGTWLLRDVDEAAENATAGVSLLRRVGDDPKQMISWSVCRVDEMPEDLGGPYNLISCPPSAWNGLSEFAFNADTGRFTLADMGDWRPSDQILDLLGGEEFIFINGGRRLFDPLGGAWTISSY